MNILSVSISSSSSPSTTKLSLLSSPYHHPSMISPHPTTTTTNIKPPVSSFSPLKVSTALAGNLVISALKGHLGIGGSSEMNPGGINQCSEENWLNHETNCNGDNRRVKSGLRQKPTGFLLSHAKRKSEADLVRKLFRGNSKNDEIWRKSLAKEEFLQEVLAKILRRYKDNGPRFFSKRTRKFDRKKALRLLFKNFLIKYQAIADTGLKGNKRSGKHTSSGSLKKETHRKQAEKKKFNKMIKLALSQTSSLLSSTVVSQQTPPPSAAHQQINTSGSQPPTYQSLTTPGQISTSGSNPNQTPYQNNQPSVPPIGAIQPINNSPINSNNAGTTGTNNINNNNNYNATTILTTGTGTSNQPVTITYQPPSATIAGNSVVIPYQQPAPSSITGSHAMNNNNNNTNTSISGGGTLLGHQQSNNQPCPNQTLPHSVVGSSSSSSSLNNNNTAYSCLSQPIFFNPKVQHQLNIPSEYFGAVAVGNLKDNRFKDGSPMRDLQSVEYEAGWRQNGGEFFMYNRPDEAGDGTFKNSVFGRNYNDDCSLYVLCEGSGECGKEVSEKVCALFSSRFSSQNPEDINKIGVERFINDSFEYVKCRLEVELGKQILNDGETTASVVFRYEDKVYIACVGNTKIAVLKRGSAVEGYETIETHQGGTVTRNGELVQQCPGNSSATIFGGPGHESANVTPKITQFDISHIGATNNTNQGPSLSQSAWSREVLVVIGSNNFWEGMEAEWIPAAIDVGNGAHMAEMQFMLNTLGNFAYAGRLESKDDAKETTFIAATF